MEAKQPAAPRILHATAVLVWEEFQHNPPEAEWGGGCILLLHGSCRDCVMLPAPTRSGKLKEATGRNKKEMRENNQAYLKLRGLSLSEHNGGKKSSSMLNQMSIPLEMDSTHSTGKMDRGVQDGNFKGL